MGKGGRGPSASSRLQGMVHVKSGDVEPHRTGNQFIISRYRPMSQVSLFRLHNQTANIWSHILGLPFVIARFLQPLDPQQPFLSAVLMVHVFAGFLCAVLSIGYHMYEAFPKDFHDYMLSLDQAGAFIGIASHGLIITAFELTHRWQWAFRSIMATLLSVIVFGVWFCLTGGLLDSVRGRACMVMFLPVTITTVAWICALPTDSTPALIETAITLGTATFLWVGKMPERFLSPGTLDLFGNSHNIMHVLVVFVFLQLQWLYSAKLLAGPPALDGPPPMLLFQS